MTPEIEILRQKIDLIEDELIALLNKRTTFVVEIGKIKKELGLPITDSKREEMILNRVAQKNPGNLSDEFLRDIFKSIIKESVRIESNE